MDKESGEEMLAVAPEGAAEVWLIEESTWKAVRGLREQGLSRKAIARELELDIKTVRKWLGRSWAPQRRSGPARGLDVWESFLRGRAPEVGFNAAVLYRELQGQGYAGSYPTVVRYLRPWREEALRDQRTTVRFETDPGQQAQVDWGSAWVWLSEQRVRVHLFVMVLGYSRRIFVRGYLGEGLEALLDGHARAFEHFGGRTATILYDNPRTIVLSKDEASGVVEWNATFKDRMDFYGVQIRLCRYYRARTKGKVESGVKYVKRNGLAGRRFRDLEALNTGARDDIRTSGAAVCSRRGGAPGGGRCPCTGAARAGEDADRAVGRFGAGGVEPVPGTPGLGGAGGAGAPAGRGDRLRPG
jgi:transposase